MTKQYRTKCLICEVRPRYKGSKYCHNCGMAIAAESNGNGNAKAEKYLTYQGAIVGLFKNGKDTFKPKIVNVSLKGISKSKVIDLDNWCEGYTRDQVKAFKRCINILARV